MKRQFALLALALATPLIAAPKAWPSVATAAPQGSYVIGNPKARVKLIEYVSYTCPRCAQFARESAATLKGRMIASGSLSLEVRSVASNKFDLAATTLARCAGPTLFPRFHDMLFEQQQVWVERAVAFDRTNGKRLAMYDQAAQLRALADGAGLTDMARGLGMAPAAIDACFTDPANVRAVLAVAQAAAGKIHGTPSFELGSRVIDHVDWAALEPKLRAAGAR